MNATEFAAKYGPWALVAGASEGTGASFCRQLAEKGLNLVMLARREGPLTALAENIREEYGVECVTASLDLSVPEAAQRMMDIAGGREIGLLILNAGADANGAMFLENDLANWDELTMRNVMTVMRSCYLFAGPMSERKRGGIMIVGSGACYGGLPGITVYNATKAFDLVFSEGLWAEMRKYDVDVLSLIMGRTDTPAHRDLMARKGGTVPDGLASSDDVARIGLERLPHGPIHNWDLEDDEPGYAVVSAAGRRERVVQIAAAMNQNYLKRD